MTDQQGGHEKLIDKFFFDVVKRSDWRFIPKRNATSLVNLLFENFIEIKFSIINN